MTNKLLHLLKALSRQQFDGAGACRITLEGVDEEDIEQLMEKDLVRVTSGEGYMAGVQILHLTVIGQEFIKDFCETCECMPCDCYWGHQ